MASLSTLKKAAESLEKQLDKIWEVNAYCTISVEESRATRNVLSDISSNNIHVVETAMNDFFENALDVEHERAHTAVSYVESAIRNIQREISVLENGGPKSNEYC